MFPLYLFIVNLGFFFLIIFIIVLTAPEVDQWCYPSLDCGHGESRFDCGNSSTFLNLPFRNQGDPNFCNIPHFNLSCHHNRPVLHTSPDVSQEVYNSYYVVELDSINYEKKTIDHVIDPGLQKGNCSSLPLFRFTESLQNVDFLELDFLGVEELVFVSCPNPMKSESKSKFHRLVDTASCNVSERLFGNIMYSYEYVGLASNLAISDIEESCAINAMVPTNIGRDYLPEGQDVSFHHIHDLMAAGFQLRWYNNLICPSATYLLMAGGVSLLIGHARNGIGILLLFVFLIYKWRRRPSSFYDSIEEFLQANDGLMPIL